LAGDSAQDMASGLFAALQADALLSASGYTFALDGTGTNISITPAANGAHYAWQAQVVGTGTETITNPGADWTEPNAIQEIHLDATGGSFALAFDGAHTAALDWNIGAAGLQQALENLSSIGTGNVAVTKNDDVYVLRFQGTLSNRAVSQVTAFDSNLVKVSENPDGTLAKTVDSTPNAAGTTQLIGISTRVTGQPNPGLND